MRWRYFPTLHSDFNSIELKQSFQDVDLIGPGEICAVFGIECASGDTFTDGTTQYSMTNMFVPDPVISLSIKPEGTESPNFSRALNRFQKEDPTFRVHVDSESQEVRTYLYLLSTPLISRRPSFLEWGSFTWRFMRNA